MPTLVCLWFLHTLDFIPKHAQELNPFLTVVCAVNALAYHVLNKDLRDIVGDFRGFYRQLTSDRQLRWVRGLFCKMLL